MQNKNGDDGTNNVRHRTFTITGKAMELNKKAMEQSRNDVIEYIKKCDSFVFIGREEGEEGKTISAVKNTTVGYLIIQMYTWIDKITNTLWRKP